jgi:hypothetical protein
LRAPQAVRKRMVLSLRSYLKKTRKRLGIVKTVWRWGTSSITSLWMCSANFTARLAPHEGHTPRRLQEKAIRSECLQPSQYTLAAP